MGILMWKMKMNIDPNNLVSNDFKQIFPGILQIAENSRINYEQVANIFIDLQKEMQEDLNKTKEIQENILPPDIPETKKPILKINQQFFSNDNNKTPKSTSKIKKQKSLNLKKRQKMKITLKKVKEEREEINLKSQIRQEKYIESAKLMKLEREKEIQKRSQSQSELFAINQKNKDIMKERLVEKYNQLEKEMKEKEQKREKEKQEKLYNISMKQEDDYLKQYEKKQNIDKIERINQYKNEKRNEEILRKEKKMEDFKKKKNELILSKSKQADKFEKEKEKLIVDFEKNFRKKENFDTNQLIQNLFPTKDLSENDTKLKKKIEKLIEEMQKTDPKNLTENNTLINNKSVEKENA